MNQSSLRHAKILIVEDNMADVVFIKRFFAEEGISNDVSYTTNMQQATEVLEKHHFDICFIDILLPDGEGLELIKSIDTDKTTVIMLSGSENIKHVIEARGLGAVAYITKPLNRHTLDRLVKELKQLHWSLMVC